LAEGNRLPYALASYAFTSSSATNAALAARLEAGMLGINQTQVAWPELPFGGIKDSGYGREGGSEAIQDYLVTKLVTQAAG
jgi:succinate-semialdehyde dehydrogenase / glutarate-semialdehyde dehydrogenase